MDYHKYIASAAWREKRRQRMEIDEHKCVVCKSTERLSVHHLTYDRLGHEDALHDLVTVCEPCHRRFDTIERYGRYAKRQYSMDMVSNPVQERGEINGLGNSEIPIDFHGTTVDAQRTTSESTQQVDKINEEDHIKARENRR